MGNIENISLIGQCLKCKDMFTLDGYLSNGMVRLDPTMTIALTKGSVIHKPVTANSNGWGTCGGEIKLYPEWVINWTSKKPQVNNYDIIDKKYVREVA